MRLAEGHVMQDTAMVPRKSDGKPPVSRPLVDDQLADELLGKAQAEGVELLGPDGLLSQVTKAVLERALAEEMTGHLGYDKHDPAGRGSGSNRNGTTGKTVLTGIGAVDLAVPRDRNGTFEPKIVRKGQTRLDGFNERIIVCEGTSGSGSGGTTGCGAAGSEAERLGDEDDGDPAGGVAVDDQRLGEHASSAAGALHTGVFARQAVFADAAQAFAEIGDELLVPDDEDDVAGSVGVGAELAARAGAHDDLAGVGDRVCAADDVVGRGAELGYLARLCRPVERRQPGTDRVVASGLVDLGRDAEFTHRLGQGDVDLGT